MVLREDPIIGQRVDSIIYLYFGKCVDTITIRRYANHYQLWAALIFGMQAQNPNSFVNAILGFGFQSRWAEAHNLV